MLIVNFSWLMSVICNKGIPGAANAPISFIFAVITPLKGAFIVVLLICSFIVALWIFADLSPNFAFSNCTPCTASASAKTSNLFTSFCNPSICVSTACNCNIKSELSNCTKFCPSLT